MGWRSPAQPTPQIDSSLADGLLSVELLGPLVTIACVIYVALDTALLTKAHNAHSPQPNPNVSLLVSGLKQCKNPVFICNY